MSEKEFTVIKPERAFSLKFIREIYEYRELLFIFVKRDISVRYRNTFIGVGWVLLQPLLSTIIFVAVFYRFVKMPVYGNSAFVFYLAGLIPWYFFSTSINKAYTSLISHQYIISRIYFPRIILPLTTCITSLYDCFFQILAFFIVAIIVGAGISWKIIFLIPLFLWLFLISFGLSLWVSVLSVIYRDIQHLVPFFLQLLFFLTPIFYTYNNIPSRFKLYTLFNPLVLVEEYSRWIFLPQYQLGDLSALIPMVVTFIIIIGGLIFFNKKSGTIADIL